MINNLLTFACLGGLTLILLERRFSVKASVLILLALRLALYALQGLRDSFAGVPVVFGGALLAQIAATQGAMLLLAKRRGWGTVFAGFSAAVYDTPGSILGQVVFQLARQPLWGAAAAACMHGLVLWCAWRLGRPTFLYFQRGTLFCQPWACLIPALFFACTYTLCTYPLRLADNLLLAIPAGCVLAMMSLCYALVFLNARRQQAEAELARDNDVLTAYAGGLTRELEGNRAANEQMALLRHDSRHAIRMLHGLLAEGRVGDALEALERMDRAYLHSAPRAFCKHTAVNAIMGEMDAIAARAGVELAAALDVPGSLPFSGPKLASVFANVVENAIEAVAALPPWDSRPRRVTLKAAQGKRRFTLECANPCGDGVLFDKGTGLPISQKGPGHGLGVRSVAAFTRQHGGILDAAVEDGTFFLRILLPIERQ